MADISRAEALALINQQNMMEVWQEAAASSVALSSFRRVNMSSKQTKVPVLDVLPTAGFVNGDSGVIATTDQRWVNKYLEAEKIACIVPIPVDVFDDSEFNVWDEVRPRIAEAVGAKLDAAVLLGTGAPTSWTIGGGGPGSLYDGAVAAGNVISRGTTEGTNLGAVTLTDTGDVVTTGAAHNLSINDRVRFGAITTTTGLTAGQDYYVKTTASSTTLTVSATPGGATVALTTDGSAAALYDMTATPGRDLAYSLSELAGLVEDDDYDPDVLYTRRALRRELRNLRDANGQFLYQAPTAGSGNINGGTVDGLDILYVRNGAMTAASAAQAIAGSRDHAILGVRKDMTFSILSEATLTDGAGNVTLSLAETDNIALKVVFRCGFQVADATTVANGGTGYPFSVLQN